MISEISLIEQLKNASSKNDAFRELVKQYKERLYWHIRKIVISHDDADDVLQNTFIKIFKNIDIIHNPIDYNNFNYIVGDKNCKVLIVKENMKTEWNGEQLVVAEPNAEIIFKGTKMKVGQDPLGNIDNIEDARYWIINNKKFKPLLKEKNVVFIATGSPAKILWKKFLKHR